MKFKLPNFSLRFQHLLLYFILLTIPVFILSYTIHFSLLKSLQDEVRVSREKELTQVKEVIDAKLEGIDNISYTVSTMSEFSPNYLTNYLQVRNTKKFLNYKIFDPFIYDLLYYSRNDDYLFSYNTSYTVANFFHNHYKYLNWSANKFHQDITESRFGFLRPAEEVLLYNGDQVNIITYGIPIPLNSNQPYGTLLFLLDEQILKNMLSNIVGSTDGFAYILTGDGEAIANANGNKLEIRSLVRQLKESDMQFQTMDLNDERYYVSNIKSDYNDQWLYIAATPERELMENVNVIKNTVLISYILILIVGGTLIHYAMKTNYQPLRKLISKVTDINKIRTTQTGIERVFEEIDQSREMNETLSKLLEKNEPIIQQHLFISLLRGEIDSYEKLNELGTDVNLALNQSCYYVMLFDIEHDGLTNSDKNELARNWISMLPNEEKHNVYLLETSIIATILSGEIKIRDLNSWYEENVRNNKYNVTIGVGTSYDEAIEVGRSHLEAMTALDYKLIKGTDQIIFFDQLADDHSGLNWYDKQMIERLGYYIRHENEKEVKKYTAEILTVFKRDKINLFMAKSLFYELSSMLMQLVVEMRTVSKEDLSELPNILLVSDFHSISDIGETVQTMIDQVFNMYLNVNKNEEDDFIKQMINYMEENHTDYQFTISTLANHFELSETYLMRYFKEHMGKTILQYLTKLRIDHAKHILLTTDRPIKDIVNEIGYSDVSSFIRRFKKETNYTPGEFRKKR